MFELLQNTPTWLPVVLVDKTGSAINGVAANDVLASFMAADMVNHDVTVSASWWTQLTGTAYLSEGYYNIYISGTYLATTGVFQYGVKVSGSQLFRGAYKVVATDAQKISDKLGAPNYGTIANDIANVGVTAGSGGFTSADRLALQAVVTSTRPLPIDPASMSGVLSIVTQSFWASDRTALNVILTSTNRIPADPATSAAIANGVSTLNTSITNAVNNIRGATGRTVSNVYDLITGSGGTVVLAYLTGIYGYARNLPSDPASTSGVLSIASGVIGGTNYDPNTDSLHALAAAIAGISGGESGGVGGFGQADRAALQSILTSTSYLPVDPTSWATVNAAITSSMLVIMGSGSGHGTGSNIWQVAQDTNAIRTHTNYIQTTNQVATTAEVNAARDYLAGSGYVAASSSLASISAQFTGSNYTVADRAMISGGLANIMASESLNRADFSAIRNKTDPMPLDVVSTVHIDPLLNQIISASAASGGFSIGDRENILAILTSTSRLPLHPADQDVTFGTSDRNYAIAVYGKTQNLPPDPVSTTYVTLVSQSLAQLVTGSYSGTAASLVAMSATLLGVGTIASSTLIQAATANSNAQAAAGYANTAAGNSAITVQNTNVIGASNSGTITADLAGLASQIAHISGAVASATVDLSPVTRKQDQTNAVLGAPVTTISRDILEVARLVKLTLTGTRR